MYIRFAVADIDGDSGHERGVFQALDHLQRKGKLYPHEEDQWRFLEDWFDKNLAKPSRFTGSKPPYYRKKNRAISWFKDTAHEHIRRIREMVTILENHGVAVRMLKTDRVGYVVYEDEYQVVAEAFADMRR